MEACAVRHHAPPDIPPAVPRRALRQVDQACEADPAIIVEGIMRIAATAIIALCMAAPAAAFGTGGDGSVGGLIGPLIMLAVAVVFVLVLVVEARWRKRKLNRDESGN